LPNPDLEDDNERGKKFDRRSNNWGLKAAETALAYVEEQRKRPLQAMRRHCRKLRKEANFIKNIYYHLNIYIILNNNLLVIFFI
jgi:hypothetical protein